MVKNLAKIPQCTLVLAPKLLPFIDTNTACYLIQNFSKDL